MTDDLVKRLRTVDISWSEVGEWCAEAADLLDECERAFQDIINSGGYRGSVAHADFVDALSRRVLHKLRAQAQHMDAPPRTTTGAGTE